MEVGEGSDACILIICIFFHKRLVLIKVFNVTAECGLSGYVGILVCGDGLIGEGEDPSFPFKEQWMKRTRLYWNS